MREILENNLDDLDVKKEQTTYKIKYVKSYVEKWLYVFTSRTDTKIINFIDCMCNAGIYTDGDYCTSIEILNLFLERSKRFKNKIFNLFLNDNNANRIRIIKQVCDKIITEKPANLNILFSCDDVNNYILGLAKQTSSFGFDSATILYVDPYNFGTVKISVLKNFISKYYCELIYNVFTSDVTRNGFNSKILNCIDNKEDIKYIRNQDDFLDYMVKELEIGKMKFHFYYAFKNQNNAELYEILFMTPNKLGIEKLKDTLWDVFDGKQFHRNSRINNSGQMSFLDTDIMKEFDKKNLIGYYSRVSQYFLSEKYKGQCLSYNEIELFILTKTMLKTVHVIDYVIKPMMENMQIKKMNKIPNKNNFKNDYYVIL